MRNYDYQAILDRAERDMSIWSARLVKIEAAAAASTDPDTYRLDSIRLDLIDRIMHATDDVAWAHTNLSL